MSEKGCGNRGSEADQLADPQFLLKMGFVFYLEAPLGEQGFCAGSLSLLLILPVSLSLVFNLQTLMSAQRGLASMLTLAKT